MDVSYKGAAGKASLEFKKQKIAQGGVPNMTQDPNSSTKISLILHGTKGPISNDIKKSLKDKNPKSMHLKIEVPMEVNSWAKTLQKDMTITCDYKNGRFAEALALYDTAISIDPNKASYRSNKSHAQTALGKLLEAAFECREAIRIDPYYQRAHIRLATLYTSSSSSEHLCTEAKRQRDWNTLVKEAALAIAAGADSAPLIFSLKAEALLKLRKHQEADETMAKGPNFDIDECIKFFGPIASASLLLVHAQVNMVVGRLVSCLFCTERDSITMKK
ncbi:Kinesin light chain [Forsythia ovata]|uniref:Kinesin light chain n=1 Tax=Forsythia ovata TaxID=205694 RepID=A0ABD1U9F8_9LAMI